MIVVLFYIFKQRGGLIQRPKDTPSSCLGIRLKIMEKPRIESSRWGSLLLENFQHLPQWSFNSFHSQSPLFRTAALFTAAASQPSRFSLLLKRKFKTSIFPKLFLFLLEHRVSLISLIFLLPSLSLYKRSKPICIPGKLSPNLDSKIPSKSVP